MMPLRALLATRDHEVVRNFADAVPEMPLDWILVEERDLAIELLKRENIDLLVVDHMAGDAPELIDAARNSEINHRCVILAYLNDALETGIATPGADVYLRCRDRNSIAETLRSTMPLLQHERRWSRRHPVLLSVHMQTGSERFLATALNLSVGGMMAHLRAEVGKFAVILLSFQLPGAESEMKVYGKIVWAGPNDVVGIRFLGLTNDQMTDLANWSNAQPG